MADIQLYGLVVPAGNHWHPDGDPVTRLLDSVKGNNDTASGDISVAISVGPTGRTFHKYTVTGTKEK